MNVMKRSSKVMLGRMLQVFFTLASSTCAGMRSAAGMSLEVNTEIAPLCDAIAPMLGSE